MPRVRHGALANRLEQFSTIATHWSGSSPGFSLACAIVIVWIAVGPIFHFSDTWQLTINTATTIVTFLMVFLIQRSQNKDSLALQLKLNELVAAIEGASNRLIDIEDLSEEELEVLHKHYQRLVVMAKKDFNLTHSHSIDEADQRHSSKATTRGGRRKA